MLTIVKSLNLALAFVLELCLLVAFAYGGVRIGSGWIARGVLGIGMPALVIVVWGAFLAPTAARRLQFPWLLLAKTVLFGAAAVLLFAVGLPAIALLLAALFVVSSMLAIAWGQ